MGTELAKIEPLKLPDVRRAVTMPPLPGWVGSRLESLRESEQPDQQTGRYRTVMALPKSMVLASSERILLERHIRELEQMATRTPINDAQDEAATLVVVTKMLLALPAANKGETGAEARGEAYMAALDDVPSWSVAAAVRLWYRGECGQKHDYRWAPVPAELRNLAHLELWRVAGRSAQLRRLLLAEELLEFSEEHCATMRGRIAELPKQFGIQQMSEASK